MTDIKIKPYKGKPALFLSWLGVSAFPCCRSAPFSLLWLNFNFRFECFEICDGDDDAQCQHYYGQGRSVPLFEKVHGNFVDISGQCLG